MIMGIGTDLCSVSRMKRAIENMHFINRVFSEEEIEYASSKANPARHYASAFAAKEALAKASGLGLMTLGLKNSHVRRTPGGPVIVCSESLLREFNSRGVRNFWLSLSHDGDFALAVVILES